MRQAIRLQHGRWGQSRLRTAEARLAGGRRRRRGQGGGGGRHPAARLAPKTTPAFFLRYPYDYACRAPEPCLAPRGGAPTHRLAAYWCLPALYRLLPSALSRSSSAQRAAHSRFAQ